MNISNPNGSKLLQLELLKRQIVRICQKSEFYRKKFKRARISPDQINSLEDISKIPLLTREEIQNNFHGMLSVSMEEVSMSIQTSGTTAGSPMTMAHTRNDTAMIAETKARELTLYGVTARDVAQVALPYGLWQGAWSTHWGLRELGSMIIPTGATRTQRQINLMEAFGTTVLFATPNYHLRIAEIFSQMGKNRNKLSLRLGICVAGSLTDQKIRLLKNTLGFKTIFIDYGATEFPGFCTQCPMNPDIHHIWSDNYLVEVVDPETHEPLPANSRGELVITSLRKEAVPLIRYLSKDITTLYNGYKCKCGLSCQTIDADICREDFMVKVRGIPIFPGQIERFVQDFPGITGNIQIVVDRRTPKEYLTINVESDEYIPQTIDKSLCERIQRYVRIYIGITVDNINFVPKGTFGDKFQKSIVLE